MSDKPLILLVDDDPVVHKLLSIWLTRAEMEVLEAFRGQEGLELAAEHHPDLILLDVMMPEMDGFEVCRRLKGDPATAEIPVIFLSAKVEAADKVQGLELGAADYVDKPVDRAEILARIGVHLKLKRQEEQLRDYAHNLEKMVEERTQQLIHADRLASLGTLSAGIAHEINNPTTFIMGNLQIIEHFWAKLSEELRTHPQAGDDPQLDFILEEFPRIIRSLRNGADRIANIVSGLKTFARKDSSLKGPTDLARCVDEALELTHGQLKYRVKVEKDLEPDLPPLWANAQQTVQVLVALILNAADALGPREGRLEITGRMAEDGLVRVRLADNGPGMKPEVKDKIFDPFFTTKPLGEGTGLGLAIAHGIMTDHGGTIEVDSEPGKGTTFTLTFPTEKTL